MEERVPWHATVLERAERFTTFWQKGEEEASRQGAIKRGDNGPRNNLVAAPISGTGGGRTEATEKRPTGWRDMLRVKYLVT